MRQPALKHRSEGFEVYSVVLKQKKGKSEAV